MDLGGSSEGWMTTHERRASALRFDTGGVYPKPAEPPLPGILRGRLFRGRTALIVGLAAVAPGCANLNLFSVNQDAELGAQAYTEILGPEKLITSGADHAMVTRLMEELVEAARYEEPAMVDAFEWEVSLIDNDEVVNAFALPGGKMAVYTGILPVAGSDAGLAVVPACHGALGQVAGAVAVHLKEPLQGDDSEKGQQGIAGSGAEADETLGGFRPIGGLQGSQHSGASTGLVYGDGGINRGP